MDRLDGVTKINSELDHKGIAKRVTPIIDTLPISKFPLRTKSNSSVFTQVMIWINNLGKAFCFLHVQLRDGIKRNSLTEFS